MEKLTNKSTSAVFTFQHIYKRQLRSHLRSARCFKIMKDNPCPNSFCLLLTGKMRMKEKATHCY